MNMSHVDDGMLHAYLDGELSPPDVQGVEAHLAQCSGCRTRFDEERALIARAAELLTRAAPPDRELPPFRAGDATPPARLWWQVRLPLAWAATVLLALGVGIYLGPTTSRLEAPVARADSGQPAPPPRQAPPARKLANRAPRLQAPTAPSTPLATAPAAPAPPPTAAGHALNESISADSARRLLGADLLALPGAPVRRIYMARETGYSALLIVEQVLDSGTTIHVTNGRVAAPQADSVSARPRALPRPVADSLAALGRRSDAAHAAAVQRAAEQAVPSIRVEVRGPLSNDSLAALRRLLQPLQP